MDGLEFYQRIADHAKIEWVGCREGDGASEDRVLVRVALGVMSIPVPEVRARDWPNLEAVMLGRDPDAIQHQTRIIGYFSRVRDWNRSKQRELRDRQKGLYTVAEAC